MKTRKTLNHLWTLSLLLATLIILLPLFSVVGHLFYQGFSHLSWDFLTELPGPVGEPGGGMRHALLGTLYLVGLASLMAIPTGLLCGIYLSEFGTGRIAESLRLSVDLLTGVPSIVIGIFAYTHIVVPMKSFSALAGAIALSLIIFPIVTRSTEEILKLTPRHITEAGLSLGIARWKVIFFIVVPGNLSGLITGAVLAISRAAGETAPLLFTAFGNMYTSYALHRPMASMPVQIYNYAISPYDQWRQQAWAGSLTLILLVLGLNLFCRILVNKNTILAYAKKALS